jgi:hypothetical protein
VTLRELERLCRRWLLFHEMAWQGVKDQDWVRFVLGWLGRTSTTSRGCSAARAGR